MCVLLFIRWSKYCSILFLLRISRNPVRNRQFSQEVYLPLLDFGFSIFVVKLSCSISMCSEYLLKWSKQFILVARILVVALSILY